MPNSFVLFWEQKDAAAAAEYLEKKKNGSGTVPVSVVVNVLTK